MKDMKLRLKKRMEQDKVIVVPGAYDALTGVLCERADFEAVYLTGAGVSYSSLGKPDVGLITMSEMVDKAAKLCDSISIPVVADGDNGYGNAINVYRTVREYERAGVSAIQLEDQKFPKRCGHLADKTLISTEEMMAKIQAAVDSRLDPNLQIIARTDARATDGLNEAIERAARYLEAGADILFVEAPETVEEMKKITSAIRAPLVANMVEGGKTPMLSVQELEEIGYRMVLFPNSVTRIIAKTALEFYRQLNVTGTTAHYDDRMVKFYELNELLGIEEFRHMENKYKKENFLPR